VYSEYDYIRSGVVQGSCLGPLLFLIYMNDIIHGFDDKVNCKLYADDMKLYTELRSAADDNGFQVCLDRIYQWSLTWQLQISSQKCCVVDVGKSTAADAGYPCRLGNAGITTSENARHLGVVVDSHLRFSAMCASPIILTRHTTGPTQFTVVFPPEIATCWLKLSKFMFARF